MKRHARYGFKYVKGNGVYTYEAYTVSVQESDMINSIL